MKTTGFSLIELLVVMLIAAILLSFGFNSYKDSKLNTGTQLDQQYLLQLPALVENHFPQQFEHPDNLDDFLTPKNGQFSTPKKYYTLSYTLNGNDYSFTATANTSITNVKLTTCNKLIVHSSGQLQAFDENNNDSSDKCWD